MRLHRPANPPPPRLGGQILGRACKDASYGEPETAKAWEEAGEEELPGLMGRLVRGEGNEAFRFFKYGKLVRWPWPREPVSPLSPGAGALCSPHRRASPE